MSIRHDSSKPSARRSPRKPKDFPAGKVMQAELADMRLLQDLSLELTSADDSRSLEDRVLEAAMALMRADFASLQRYDGDRDALELLGHRNFSLEAAAYWHWIPMESGTSCGDALRSLRRVVKDDLEACEITRATPHIHHFRGCGIRACQTTPLFARSGELVGMISTHWRKPHVPTARELSMFDILARQAADLLERKRALRALSDSEARARDAVEQLREADRRKDEFIATLAHELRNPLAPLSNAVQVMRLKGQADPLLQMMDRQLNHMVRLVDELLEVSRISRGKIELRRERLELGALLTQVVDSGRPMLEAGTLSLVVDLPEAPVWLDGDPVRLTQVFTNLLTNAVKFTPVGGEVRLTARREGERVAVSVRDTGAGIPADRLGEVFELFTQLDGTRERAAGGLGIGLSLARSLVRLHGGQIEANSEGPGKGSTFTVTLNAAEPAAVPAQAPMTAPQTLNGARVLVVDDNKDAADSLGMLLTELGAQVQVVHSGEHAVALLNGPEPDAVLLDLGMPEIDGFEVARQVRERCSAKVRLIALSGWGQEEDRRRTRDAGFHHHLVKPPDPAALQALLSYRGEAPPSPEAMPRPG